ncbi:MAG TPA: NUDIX domain-containing protein [Candidatus Babeliales bacterium]|jgi:bis(5'-nucleosidyl)-tetraphosphatase|nr:NUDIX domain-containing protein [Candidatus Babeliales bacterium]
MKQLYSAGIITYTTDDDTILYLLLRYGAGHWDLPKGKIEPGETKEEAALRELMEETGLTAVINENFEESVHYIFTDYDKQLAQKTAYFFVGKATDKHVKLSHEHTDFKWLPYKDAVEQLTYDNAKRLLKKAHKYIMTYPNLQ